MMHGLFVLISTFFLQINRAESDQSTYYLHNNINFQIEDSGRNKRILLYTHIYLTNTCLEAK
jgi:hypothetical protein